MYAWDMREAMKTYARSPVHSLYALCPSEQRPRDQLIKTANLETQRGKSSQKHPGDMREAIKTYARSPIHSLIALCPPPPKDQLTKTANLETQRGKSSQKILGMDLLA